jgi:dihydroxyacetone kinase-like predicted kinase
MYFLEAPDETIPAFRDVWAGVGDSIVVVGGDGVWNCHIHTDDIGAAIEAALDCGRPRQIRVTDLFEQVEEERWVRDAAKAGEPEPAAPTQPVDCAVVAVATGPGLRRIFHSLGVHHIVAGGQTMNPATADLLQAIEAVPAPEVIVLPNNKNIVPVAEQAAALADKKVRVVPTRGIAEGFAALLEYDPQASADDNAATMAASAERVVAGEITQAVRDSSSDAGPIKQGDYLGLSRSGIEVVASGLTEAACDLLAKLVNDSHEIVTIIEGDGATKADTRRITDWLEEHRPGVSPEIHHGGQPLYPYLFSIE